MCERWASSHQLHIKSITLSLQGGSKTWTQTTVNNILIVRGQRESRGEEKEEKEWNKNRWTERSGEREKVIGDE